MMFSAKAEQMIPQTVSADSDKQMEVPSTDRTIRSGTCTMRSSDSCSFSGTWLACEIDMLLAG